jgi:hypothetical protein
MDLWPKELPIMFFFSERIGTPNFNSERVKIISVAVLKFTTDYICRVELVSFVAHC